MVCLEAPSEAGRARVEGRGAKGVGIGAIRLFGQPACSTRRWEINIREDFPPFCQCYREDTYIHQR